MRKQQHKQGRLQPETIAKESKTSLVDNLRLGPNLFDGLLSSLVPLEDIVKGLQLENFEMPNGETVSTSKGSVGSVDSLNFFDLLTRRHEDLVVTKALQLVTTPESTACERDSEIALMEVSPKVPIMLARHVSSVISTIQGDEYIFECQRC